MTYHSIDEKVILMNLLAHHDKVRELCLGPIFHKIAKAVEKASHEWGVNSGYIWATLTNNPVIFKKHYEGERRGEYREEDRYVTMLEIFHDQEFINGVNSNIDRMGHTDEGVVKAMKEEIASLTQEEVLELPYAV